MQIVAMKSNFVMSHGASDVATILLFVFLGLIHVMGQRTAQMDLMNELMSFLALNVLQITLINVIDLNLCFKIIIMI